MKTILATLAFRVMTSLTLAHSLYPYECCAERDCVPIPAHDVRAAFGAVTSTSVNYAAP